MNKIPSRAGEIAIGRTRGRKSFECCIKAKLTNVADIRGMAVTRLRTTVT
jgi:hypothetical protein